MHSKSRKWCTKKTVISITWEQSYDTIWQEDDSTARITDRLIGTEWGSGPFSSNAGMKRYQKIAVCQLASQFGYLTYNLNTNGCLNIWKMSRRADAKHSCWRSSQQSHQFFLLKYPLNCIFSCWTTTLECTAPNPPFICLHTTSSPHWATLVALLCVQTERRRSAQTGGRNRSFRWWATAEKTAGPGTETCHFPAQQHLRWRRLAAWARAWWRGQNMDSTRGGTLFSYDPERRFGSSQTEVINKNKCFEHKHTQKERKLNHHNVGGWMHTLLTLVSFCVFFVWVSGNLNFIYQWQQQADSDQ